MVTDMNFNDSAQDCESHGGALASVRSVWDQEFLSSLSFSRKTWIGGHDRNNQGVFEWLSEEAGPDGFYDNFKTDSPTNHDHQDCIMMNTDGTWNDVLCNKELVHFCQIEPSVGANSEYCKCTSYLSYTIIVSLW